MIFITAPNTLWGHAPQYFAGTSTNKELIRTAIARCLEQEKNQANVLTFLTNNLDAQKTLSNSLKVENIRSLRSALAAATAENKLSTAIKKATTMSEDFRKLAKQIRPIETPSGLSFDKNVTDCYNLLDKYKEAKQAWQNAD